LPVNLSCELSVLKHFGESHPDLVHFKGAIAAGGHVIMVMGLADRGDLRITLQDPGLTWKVKHEMACGMQTASMHYMKCV
jgi:hypothetical protein